MAVSLGELATRFGCELIGDPAVEVSQVGTLTGATPGSISFLANPAYRPLLRETAATAVILAPDDAGDCPVHALISDNPYLCYARVATVLHPPPGFVAGVQPGASVAGSAVLGEGAHVAAAAVVGEDCVLGARVYVGPGCVLGRSVTLGDDCRLHANCTLMHSVQLGHRVVVHPGAVIGSDGFGNARSPDGWVKVPQVGSVRIGDDVEIGANTAIDRGAIDDTVIENGVRLDNLVQIAHNVHIGEHTALASMVGIAGSSRIGKRCLLAGQAGLVGHITICDDVVIGGATMVSKHITRPGFYTASFPAEPDRDWKRKVARFRRLDDLADRVRQLERDRRNND